MKFSENMEIFSESIPGSNQWKEDRSCGIGGSDAAAACGLSEYKSRFQLWHEKKGIYNIEIKNNFTEWGKKLESIIAEKFIENNKHLNVVQCNKIFRSKKNKFMLGNYDRIILNEQDYVCSGLEIKNLGEFKNTDIINDDILNDYILQCQHYMSITGVDNWYFACLVGGNKYYEKLIERDNELISLMIEKEKEFIYMVENDIMPDPGFNDKKIIDYLYERENKTGKKILDIDIESLISSYKEADSQIKDFNKIKDALRNKIILSLDNFELGETQSYNISYKKQNNFNELMVLEKYPDLYKQYLKMSFDNKSFEKDYYKLYKECTEKGSRKFIITNKKEF